MIVECVCVCVFVCMYVCMYVEFCVIEGKIDYFQNKLIFA